MNRVVTLIVTGALLLLSATDCLAVFPEPYGYGGNRMSQGWFDSTQAWYLADSLSSNDIDFLRGFRGGSLSPKLSSLLQPKSLGGEVAARPMYIVLNPGATQGPIFSAAPGQDPPDMLYSGFWQVFYILWKPEVTPRPIINDTPGDPQGLPDASEADISATSIVAQFPIVATGPLGGRWLPAPTGRYRIEQGFAMSDYTRTKLLFLPVYQIFCRDYISRRVRDVFTLILDTADDQFADLIGANRAPGLLNVPDGTVDPGENDTQAFYWIPDSPWDCQFPVIEACPLGFGATQRNPDFTPVARVVELGRNIPFSTVLSNPEYIRFLLSTGGLFIVSDSNRMGMIVFAGG